jgi:hypothetical protein
MKLTAFLAVIFLSVCAYGAELESPSDLDDSWALIEMSTEYETSIKTNSLQVIELGGTEGETMLTMVGRIKELKTSDAVLVKWSLFDQACFDEYGVIRSSTLSGQPISSHDFAFGAGTDTAAVAVAMCNEFKARFAQCAIKSAGEFDAVFGGCMLGKE